MKYLHFRSIFTHKKEEYSEFFDMFSVEFWNKSSTQDNFRQEPKVAGQKEFSVFSLAMFFKFKSENTDNSTTYQPASVVRQANGQ